MHVGKCLHVGQFIRQRACTIVSDGPRGEIEAEQIKHMHAFAKNVLEEKIRCAVVKKPY